MKDLSLADKKIVVVGMGLTGLSCVRFLKAKGAQVIAMDSRSELALNLEVPLLLGDFDGARLKKADLIVLSPGVDLHLPVIQEAIKFGVQVIGDIELFAQFNEVPVIAITGSNGKSTVTQLVVNICKAAGKKVLMGGNIGIPVLNLFEESADVIVLELSSFQLETTFSLAPVVATVLNVSEDHLDRHGDLEAYQKIKLSIYKHAQNAVCNRDDILSYEVNLKPALSFGSSFSQEGFSWDNSNNCILLDQQPYLYADTCLLVGVHNMLNIQAAAALTKVVDIDDESIKQGAREFGGLPHRCQTVSLEDDIRWINDSKATNVGATLAAIKGLMSDVKGKLILIAGGEGKGADFTPLNECIGESVDVLITLGKDGNKIKSEQADCYGVTSIEEAVNKAAALANPGDTVLLSPACASLDMFASFQQRGDCFTAAVKELSL